MRRPELVRLDRALGVSLPLSPIDWSLKTGVQLRRIEAARRSSFHFQEARLLVDGAAGKAIAPGQKVEGE